MKIFSRAQLLSRLPRSERATLGDIFRNETVGGALLLIAAMIALLWANFASESYESFRHIEVGSEALHLRLSLQKWASEGLLAIFFLVAGLELKRELIIGELRKPSRAVLPVVAAFCGVAGPAIVYLIVAWGEPGALRGWAVPTATDIAFALAVLAVIGSALPTAARAFLLSLAVIDDVIAITILTVFYPSNVQAWPLVLAVICVAAYAALQRLRLNPWLLLVVFAPVTWWLVHEGGIHATVAGVAIGLATRMRRDRGEHHSPGEKLEHQMRPVSAGFAAPVFALMAAGVPFGLAAIQSTFSDPAALGVIAGLVAGASGGVFLGTWITVRLTKATLSPDLAWSDVLGIALLSGIGFTVALLIGDLAYTADAERSERVRAAVLLGSLISAVLAAILLRIRNRHYLAVTVDDPATSVKGDRELTR